VAKNVRPASSKVEMFNDRVECFNLVVKPAEFYETAPNPNVRHKSDNQGQYFPRHNLRTYDELANAILVGTFFDALRGDIAFDAAKPRIY
jgi:hypothetical protein